MLQEVIFEMSWEFEERIRRVFDNSYKIVVALFEERPKGVISTCPADSVSTRHLPPQPAHLAGLLARAVNQ